MPGATLAADLWISEYLTPHDVWQHGVERILTHLQTPFQEMYVVESGAYGKALVLDGKWQTCTGDEFLYHEPLVHTPFVVHGHPRRVLIAGGADGGAAREALKLAQPEIARGAGKGALPKNTASRKISRMSARIKALGAAK